ncbi:hypothetical protein ACOMHN_058202 [Nucella lapillus]
MMMPVAITIGSVCSEDVREIGSAMASTILGEIRSDSTILGDEVVLPTLEGVLAEGQTIEDELVDNTMASLLSANDTPTRQSHKTVWQTIKKYSGSLEVCWTEVF